MIVTVPHPCNSLDDGDYVAQSFDEALAWLPKWQKANRLYIDYMATKEALESNKLYTDCLAAKAVWEAAQQELKQLPKAS